LFTNGVLAAAVRPLAARILALAADLGLRKVVVVGGFAHGVGGPWLAALRSAIRDASVDAGWFTGWGDADFDDLLVFPDDQDISPLSGIAAYAHARRDVTRETVKPVGSGTLTVRSCSRPLCGREQFAVEVAFAGICSTDLQILRGERACEPGVPGHECVGRVTEVGAAVAGSLAVGDVVGLNPNGAEDGYGKLGHDVPGVFRDVFIGDLGLIARGQVIKLPEAGRSEWVLLELLAGVIRAQDALGDLTGRSLVVLGAGVAGMLHVMLARLRNASTVLVATRSRRRIDDAVRRGIVAPDETLPWGSGLAAAVRARTDDRGADAAVIALAGAAGPDAAAWLWPALAPDAVVHLFGGFPSGSVLRLGNGGTVNATAIRSAAARQEAVSPSGVPVVLCGTRGGRHSDLVAARDLCTAPEPALDLGRLVSHVITLDALPTTATELAANGTIGGAPAWRAVIDMRRPGPYAGPVTGRPPALAGESPA
jgi:threonine dehydrogenase-like Zn-dependent dehydrogenase